MSERQKHVYLAKLAEQAERYDEMVAEMQKVVKDDPAGGLRDEERNLLSVAYKNIIGARRASWRILSSLEEKEQQKGNSEHADWINGYIRKVETELSDICNDILKILDTVLIPSSTEGEAQVFYYKMKGDYYRYIAEFLSSDQRYEAGSNSLSAYQSATDLAAKSLGPTNPIRLGLALNFSVFYYEILGKPDKACQLAKKAFDDAIAELDQLPEESYKDSTLIMQLLRDNLTLWASDMENDDGANNE